ncbi:MAG TPA: hypothetical protein VE029_12740 [Rhizobacter sp.]|nr:hypothetical protein [Rhizobacter sp.]
MPLRDFEDSTLWRISAFERMRLQTGSSGFARLEGPTVLPTTLLADLQNLQGDLFRGDVLDIMAVCLRHREAALMCLQHEQLVWPVTLFPSQMLYHSPRDMAEASVNGLASLKVLTVEPPGVKPPGHWMHERVAHVDQYRPLVPLLWSMALHGPRGNVLSEIGGRSNYRAVNGLDGELPKVTGALGSAVQRLRRESSSLRDIASWPGMSVERANRLLNAMYLSGNLMVIRTQSTAPPRPYFGAGSAGKNKTRR